MRAGAVCPPSKCGPKCLLLGLISAVLMAAGLWLLVGGVMMQWSAMSWQKVLAWYSGGFVLWCIAKCAKMKACPSCK
ncbi:hypothetical protein D6825_00855 [Candidatus Woesearchaeota archaeon]|nr:MAG: hypothetical protein D6825_00855 [Candidatus Woesearchaeota archaeon]